MHFVLANHYVLMLCDNNRYSNDLHDTSEFGHLRNDNLTRLQAKCVHERYITSQMFTNKKVFQTG